MNKKVLRQIFVAGAIGVAFGYLLALRFGSWWFTVGGAFVALLTCDAVLTVKVIKDIVDAVKAGWSRVCANFSTVFGKIAYLAVGAVRFGVPIVASVLLLIFVSDIIGIMIGRYPSLRNSDMQHIFVVGIPVFGTGVGAFLFFFLSGEVRNSTSPENKILFPLWWSLIRYLKRTFPEKKRIENKSAPTEAVPLKIPSISSIYLTPEGKLMSKKGLRSAVIDTVFCFLLPIGVKVIFYVGGFLAILATALLVVLLAIDAVLSLLLGITTSKSVAAAIGAFIGAALEYHLFHGLSATLGDAARFGAFMMLGGALGTGFYAVREKVLKMIPGPEVKPQKIAGTA